MKKVIIIAVIAAGLLIYGFSRGGSETAPAPQPPLVPVLQIAQGAGNDLSGVSRCCRG